MTCLWDWQVVGAIGSMLGGLGACAAAWISKSSAEANNKERANEKAQAHQAEQRRAKISASANYDEATNELLAYQPEFSARARSLIRRHRRAGSPKTVTDIDLLVSQLRAQLNALGTRFNEEKKSVFNAPAVAVADWGIEEIKSRDVIGQARTQISTCRYKLNDFEDDLENVMAAAQQ